MEVEKLQSRVCKNLSYSVNILDMQSIWKTNDFQNAVRSFFSFIDVQTACYILIKNGNWHIYFIMKTNVSSAHLYTIL